MTAGSDWLALGSATLSESGATSIASPPSPLWIGAAVAGPAFPVAGTPGHNLAVHAAVAHAPAGSVLVVEIADDKARGYWGEVLTVAAQARDIAGLVIDGSVRDSAAIEARGFPVFSTGLALPGAGKGGSGTIGGRARVGDTLVERDDLVVADADGVVIVSANQLDAVWHAARSRSEQEQEYFRRLQAGETTVELLGLDTSTIESA